MKSTREVILNNGNKGKEPRKGREIGERNKRTKLMEIIGEENYKSICKMHMETALYSEDEKLRASAQAFFIDRAEPKLSPLPHKTYINLPLLVMDSMDNIKENEKKILKHVSEGDISIEEGEKLFSMTEQARKTYETTEIARMLSEMDDRMKENGI